MKKSYFYRQPLRNISRDLYAKLWVSDDDISSSDDDDTQPSSPAQPGVLTRAQTLGTEIGNKVAIQTALYNLIYSSDSNHEQMKHIQQQMMTGIEKIDIGLDDKPSIDQVIHAMQSFDKFDENDVHRQNWINYFKEITEAAVKAAEEAKKTAVVVSAENAFASIKAKIEALKPDDYTTETEPDLWNILDAFQTEATVITDETKRTLMAFGDNDTFVTRVDDAAEREVHTSADQKWEEWNRHRTKIENELTKFETKDLKAEHESTNSPMQAMTYTIDPDFHADCAKGVKHPREFGGIPLLNPLTRTIELGGRKVNSKQYAGIDMDRGVVEWHSHPAPCHGNECAIALPSPRDIINVMAGSLDGVQAHMVYCNDGVYTIKVGAALLQKMRSGGVCTLRKEQCRVATALTALHNRYAESPEIYAKYRKVWLKGVNQLGLEVELTPPGQRPRIELDNIVEHNPHIPEVNVKRNDLGNECVRCDALSKL